MQEFCPDKMALLAERGEIVALRPGEFLFREGDDADAFYIVKSGVLRVMSGSTIYETVRAGGIVGEMAMVDKGAPRSASVITGTYAQLTKIGPAEFLTLIASEPDFALVVMRVMARRLRVMNARYRPISTW
jgi:CRP/FNR family cyclic AMP-dependent transcriptional regulator